MIVIKPPDRIPEPGDTLKQPAIYMAGTLNGDPWRTRLINALDGEDGTILDPVTPDWHDWVEDMTNPAFVKQVKWELEAGEKAQYIALHFEAGAPGPIAMLELGMYLTTAHGPVFLSVEEGFYKKGYIDLVALRYNVPVFPNADTMIGAICHQVQEDLGREFLLERPDLLRET